MTPSLNGNWVDLIVVIVVGFFIYEAWRHGFWAVVADFMAFLGSLLIALRAYQEMAEVLRINFSLSRSLSNAVGFLLTAVLAEAVLATIISYLIKKLPEKILKNKAVKWLSPIPALGEALILIAFVLTILIGFPISPKVKGAIVDSKIGGPLVAKTSKIENSLHEVFGGVIEDSLTYFTIQPGSRESIPIDVEKAELTPDEEGESQMFRLVNQERLKKGLPELSWEAEIVPIARAHAEDMWRRKYFGHLSPEGEDVGARLDKANIAYTLAGENLALAPTVQTAHNGLMNSEGHRENILEEKFTKVAIGVIDNGVYGKMFVQVFTD